MKQKNIVWGVVIFLLASFFVVSTKAQETQRDPLILVPGNTTSWNWSVMLNRGIESEWRFVPGQENYPVLLDALTEAGYVLGEDLFIAYYDWRKPNEYSAKKYLVPIIEQALEVTGEEKVDIISHSMGGLVTRAYIQSDFYAENIDDFIMLGTPNHGSAEAYMLWEGGLVPEDWKAKEKTITRLYLWYLQTVTKQTTDRYDTVHQTIPSLQELLPTFSYTYPEGETVPTPVTDMFWKNDFLEELNINPLDSFVYKVGKVTNIAGQGETTKEGLSVIPFEPQTTEEEKLWKDGFPDPYPSIHTTQMGDDTVLLASSFFELDTPVLSEHDMNGWYPRMDNSFVSFLLPEPLYAQGFFGGDIEQLIVDSNHTDLPIAAIPEIFEALDIPTQGSTYTAPEVPEEVLSFWFASPVEVQVTDPHGNVLSRSVQQIQDAEFFGEENPVGVKILYIPNPQSGDYTLELTGTEGGGEYHFATAYMRGIEHQDSVQTVVDTLDDGQSRSYEISVNTVNDEEPIVSDPFESIEPVDPHATLRELWSVVKSLRKQRVIDKRVYRSLKVNILLTKTALKRIDSLESKLTEKSKDEINQKIVFNKGIVRKQMMLAIKKIDELETSGELEHIVAADITNLAQKIIHTVNN